MLHRLLVVDDDARITETIRLSAGRFGLDYRIANGVDQACDLYAEYRPDIIIVPEHGVAAVLNVIISSGIPSRVVALFGSGNAEIWISDCATTGRANRQSACSRRPLQYGELMPFLMELIGRN
jgi:DNA-binding NtrC family response regulator